MTHQRSPFNYSRRNSSAVNIGNITIGNGNDIAVQSMTNTSTLDTEASVAQIMRIADAGGDIVRLTAQGVAHAENLGEIHRSLRGKGYDVPLVADIHFNPAAAFVAAENVEKVRINPGNFVDPGRTFKHLEYTDEEYAAEIEKIRSKFVPLLDLCKKNSTALRIGVNHGSLSDRIMSRYGNTPAGMVESAMEFLRICRDENFSDVVISIKASNVVVMVETVRLLAYTMSKEDMYFPLHLGVTEAGDGEAGRVKSAVGIGTLLSEGLGDTIRVSLSEAPEHEIPVGRKLVAHISRMGSAPDIEGVLATGYNPISPSKRISAKIGNIGGDNQPVVIGYDLKPEELPEGVKVITSSSANAPGYIKSQIHNMMINGDDSPVIIKLSYPPEMDYDDIVISASADMGAVLMAGFGDGLWIDAPHISQERISNLALGILQAVRLRISKTEYIACPSCGRTLFDLEDALAKVRKATSHLAGLKIGVMGCIVNGPGEMADADYGYIGAAKGNVSLYKGKECIHKNIPSDEALPLLIKLIKDNGDWIDEP